MFDTGFYPTVSLILQYFLFCLFLFLTGVLFLGFRWLLRLRDGRLHPGLWFIHPGWVRLERWMFRVWFGDGFTNTRIRPINPNLDFTRTVITIRPSLLSTRLLSRAGLAPSLLARRSRWLILISSWLAPTLHLPRCHFRAGSPLVLFLSVLRPMPEPIEDRNPFRGGLAAGSGPRGALQEPL